MNGPFINDEGELKPRLFSGFDWVDIKVNGKVIGKIDVAGWSKTKISSVPVKITGSTNE